MLVVSDEVHPVCITSISLMDLIGVPKLDRADTQLQDLLCKQHLFRSWVNPARQPLEAMHPPIGVKCDHEFGQRHDDPKATSRIVLYTLVRTQMSKAANGVSRYAFVSFSNPVYFCSTFGKVTVPSSFWKFSKIAAMIRGNANAEPFKVWQRVFLLPSLKRSLRRLL